MTSLPAGRYLGVIGRLRSDMGGQTRLVLMRQRMFHAAGVRMPILTFDGSRLYPRIRESLRASGLMAPDAQVLNLVEWFIAADTERWTPLEVDDSAWRGLDERFQAERQNLPGSVPWRSRWSEPGLGAVAYEYYRPDGTAALRLPTKHARPAGLEATAQVLAPDGTVRIEVPDQRAMRRRWLTELCEGDEPVFVISDSRYATANLHGLPENFHLLQQLHNPHLIGARHWTSTVQESYVPLMEAQNELDALVSLTERQRSDIALRYGRAENLEVISNPVEMPAPPDPLPERSTRRVVTMARLHEQKRIDQALRAFALLRAEIPDAVFDIYGRGELADELAELAGELGIAEAVTFHGYDPHARQALWTATAYWLTSDYEGYPLATLEAMSHGCPVVAFDIKYGPREQIEHGIGGYLVRQGDLRALAERTADLMSDPELLARHSAASLERARQHSHERFLADTAAVLHRVAARKATRTRVLGVDVEGLRLDFAAPSRLLHRPATGLALSLRARIAVRHARCAGAALRAEDIGLELYSTRSEAPASLPVEAAVAQTSAELTEIAVRAELDHDRVLAALEELDPDALVVRLRLGFVWRNSTWFTELAPAGFRVVRDRAGRVRALGDRADRWSRSWAGLAGRMAGGA